MSVWRIVLGIGALVLGVAALALAHDIRSWHGGVDRGDARVRRSSPRPRGGTAGTWLPGDPALALLSLRDDLAVRSGEKAFVVAMAAPQGYDDGRQKAQLRGLAELALSDALATGSPAQASRAGNLLGILAAHGRQRGRCGRQRPACRRDVRGGDPRRPGERGREVQPRAPPAPDQGGRLARGRGRLVRRLRRLAPGRGRRAAGVGLLMVASVSLLAPYGLLACLLALVPLAVVALAFRRQRRVSRALGLEPVPGRRALRAAALPAVACLLLGIAVAQPAITTTTERSARTSSEVVFVADVSRSMTASSGPGAPHPARPGAIDRRASSARPCPMSRQGSAVSPTASCPTRSRRSTADILRDARAAACRSESPPPQAVSDVATSFEPLSALTPRRLLHAGHRASHLRPRHRRRDAHRHLVERRLQAPGRQGRGRRPTASTRRTARSTPPTGPRARRRTRSSRLARAAGSAPLLGR